MSRRGKRWLIFAAVHSGIVALAGLALLYVRLVERVDSPLLLCPWHELLGLYCPTCGATRAAFALAHGRLLASLRYNPFVLLGAAVFAAFDVRAAVVIARDGERPCRRAVTAVVAFFVALVIFCVVRNVLLRCFSIDMIGDFVT